MCWLLVLFAATASTATQEQPRFRFRATDAAMIVFLVLHTISALVMAQYGQPRQTLNMLWHWIGLGASFLLIRQLVRTAVEARAIVIVMVALSVCVAMHGYYQYFYSMPVSRRAYDADPDGELRKIGLDAPPGSVQRAQFESRLRSNEPIGTFTLTNSLAGLLAPWLLFAIGTAALSRRGRNSVRRLQVTAAVSALLIGGCLVLTKSRTAWLAIICGFGVLLVYGRRTGWRPGWKLISFGGGTMLALFVVGMLLGAVDIEVLTESSKSLLYRAQYWQSTMGVIREHPLFGCGPGNFQQYYSAHKLPAASETIADPHNFVLEIWATAGTPTLIAFAAMFCCFIVATGRTASEPTPGGDDAAAESGSVSAVYWGALAGGPLAFGVGLVVQHPPQPEIFVVGLPLAAIVIVMWHDWVMNGELELLPICGALLVMAIDLLAAGGISFAGVSSTIWVLMAVALNQFAKPASWKAASKTVAGAVAVIALALLGGFWITTFRPVLDASMQLTAAEVQLAMGQVRKAEEHLLAATASDPYDSEAWQQLASLRNRIWLAAPNDRGEQAFREAVQQLLARDRHSEDTARMCGHWFVDAFRRTGDPGYLEEALGYYERASQLYPNYNLGQAQIAWTLHLLGRPEAHQAASEALRLDGLNPHAEQKLAVRTLHDRPAGGPDQPLSAGNRNAEQLMNELRR